MTEINNPLGIPDNYLRAIGSAIATWSSLEFIIDRLIGKLACNDGNRGFAITTEMQFLGKKFALFSLVEISHSRKEINQESYDILKKGISEATRLSGIRNKIVHGGWVTRPDGKTELTKFRGRGKMDYEDLFRDISELNQFIEDTGKAYIQLSAIYDSI